jgi:ubiquinone/menaquinone biosynthesis C-methylase UbiE
LETLVRNKKLRVLDAGCAVGCMMLSIRKRGKLVDLYGLDISHKVLVVGKNRLEISNNLICGDVMLLPFKQETFDLVTAIDVLEHIPNSRAFFQETKRVLKTGGILVLTTPNRLDITQLSFVLRGREHHVTGPKHINIVDKQRLQAYMLRSGFINVKVRAMKFWIPFLGRLRLFERLALKMGSMPFLNQFQIGLIAFGRK